MERQKNHLKQRMIQHCQITEGQWIGRLVADGRLFELRDIAGHVQKGGGRIVCGGGGQVAVTVFGNEVRLNDFEVKHRSGIA